jgi:hypothetical protein
MTTDQDRPLPPDPAWVGVVIVIVSGTQRRARPVDAASLTVLAAPD